MLEEARVLGLDLADLIAADTIAATQLPTVSSYLETIAPTFTTATAATYRPYWRLTSAHLGDRRLTDVTVTDLVAVVDDAAARAKRRRPGSTGRATRESCVAAMRAVFRRAADAGLITVNLAAALAKPRRTRSRRRALDDQELGELINAVRTTSNDPDLLVLRFHLESGARREGALNLRHRDLDAKRVWLREKEGRCPARSPRPRGTVGGEGEAAVLRRGGPTSRRPRPRHRHRRSHRATASPSLNSAAGHVAIAAKGGSNRAVSA
jgi:hypothetical protein